MEKKEPPHGEQDIVADYLARIVKEAGSLIEAQMLKGFEVTFSIEERVYTMILIPSPPKETIQP